MNIDSISLRDLIVALIVTGCVMGTLFPIFSWWLGYVITRYIKRQDTRDISNDRTFEAINKTLSELHVITQLHEQRHESNEERIDDLEEDVKATFMIKYTKGK